jgi:hypothetical protein
MKRILPFLAVLAGLCPGIRAADVPPLLLEYFHDPGCAVCARVDREIIPRLDSDFSGLYQLRTFDTGIKSNYLHLVSYQESLVFDTDETAVIVVNRSQAFAGWKAINSGLFHYLSLLVVEHYEQVTALPSSIPEEPPPATEASLATRMRGFTWIAVALAGLIDGINPCAISTQVFLLSVLAVMKVRARRLAMLGISFCIASFLTYFAIGFGLLRALHMLTGFNIARTLLELLMVGVLALFALLSFVDAARYHASQDARRVTLRLPGRVKALTHHVIHSGLKGHHLVLGGLAVGSAVTALESVCTGQVYVPTLVLMLKTGRGAWPALGYLLLYNAFFILPLVVAFVVTYYGTRTASLLRWSRRNVVFSKILLGLLFLAMAALLFAL